MRRVALAAALLLACASRPPASAAAEVPARFELRLDPRDVHALRFEARFVGGRSSKLAIDEDMVPAITSVEVKRGGGWERLEPAKMTAAECVTDCTVRYTLDLAKARTSHEGIVGIGPDAYLAPTPTWLMHPSPMPHGSFELNVEPAPPAPAPDRFEPVTFATGMRRRSADDPSHLVMSTGDFGEGSYAAFGALRHRLVESAGGAIELVGFQQPKLALSDDELAAWIREDGECVAQLYGRFPVARATVFIVPMPGADEVLFGRVLSMGGASIAALTGTELSVEHTHSDWVLVHEMIHLGFPTIDRERWIGEGLATYYEPVLRTRMGWRTPERTWSGFARSMHRGVAPAGAEQALDKRSGIDAIYWGGAIYVMMADVGIRVATGGRMSLDTVLRAVLAQGGDATVAWTLDQVIDVADRTTGTKLMSELRERLAVRGEHVDLDGYFAKLGVVHEGDRFKLQDGEWAAVREAITARPKEH
ncbi:MAG TPA: hypothetical protein VLM85_31280 [Polyangiaceae bacterium]|nr:hypothetical protein [Polyangiaceae bacterium]